MTERLVRVAFMSHPVAGDVQGNLARARRWLRWLQANADPEAVVIAPWLTAIEVHGENDADPLQRERGLRRSELVAARSDVVILVGGRVSSGMRREANACGNELDLTAMGDEPPEETDGP